jgi:transcriptional regulator with XRE-family HTH domain
LIEKTVKLTINTPMTFRINRDNKEVFHFIKEWRKALGLTVAQLAKEADLSASMVSQLEGGVANYSQSSLMALAAAMNLQPWQLLACGPEENQELWRTVMNRSETLRVLLDSVDEADLPALEEMLNNNCEAAVKSWTALSATKKAREDAAKGA